MNFSTKTINLFFTIAFVILVVITGAILWANSTRKTFVEKTEKSLEISRSLDQIQNAYSAAHLTSRELSIYGFTRSDLTQNRNEVEDGIAQTLASLKADEEQTANVLQIKESIANAYRNRDKVIEIRLKSGLKAGAEAANDLRVVDDSIEVQKAIQNAKQLQQKRFVQIYEKLDEYRDAVVWFFAYFLTFTYSLLFLTWFVTLKLLKRKSESA